MQAQPAVACGDSMGSDTFYNERRFLWEVVRLVQAVSCVRTAPPVRAEVYAGSTRPHTRGAGVSMGSGTSYNKRRFLWEVVRLVQAVTCVRTAPRPPYWRGAAWVQAQPAAACGDSMGSDTFYNKRRFLWEVIRSIMNGGFHGKWYALRGL